MEIGTIRLSSSQSGLNWPCREQNNNKPLIEEVVRVCSSLKVRLGRCCDDGGGGGGGGGGYVGRAD